MKKRHLRNTENHVNKDDTEAIYCGVGQFQKKFKAGDITWVRIHNCTWWPAQVVDEECVSESAKPKKEVGGEALVRLYGTYEYLYVDPVKGDFEFEKSLKENCSIREAFRKALEEDMSHLKPGRPLERGLSTFQGNATVKASNMKKLKEARIIRIKVAVGVTSQSEADCSKVISDNRPTQTKEIKKNRNDASEDKKQKENMGRNQEIAIRTKDGASNDKKLKQRELRQPMGTEKSEDERSKLPREAKTKIDYSYTRKRSNEDSGGNHQVAIEAKGGDKKPKQSELRQPMGTEKSEDGRSKLPREAKRKIDYYYTRIKSNKDSGGDQQVVVEAKGGDKEPKQSEVRPPLGTKESEDRRSKLPREAKRKVDYCYTRKKSKEDSSGNQHGNVEAKGGAYRGKTLKHEEAMETEKTEKKGRKQAGNVETQSDGASQDEKAKEDLGMNQLVPVTSRLDASVGKKLQQPETRKSRKDIVDASNSVYTRKKKVTNKARNEIKVKKLKGGSEAYETGKQQEEGPKQETLPEYLKAHRLDSVRNDTKEKLPVSSARRMKVMQNLGLIAPAGSPFK